MWRVQGRRHRRRRSGVLCQLTVTARWVGGCVLFIVIEMFHLWPQGALVSALADDSVHLWNLRQKRPAILHSLKFNRER